MAEKVWFITGTSRGFGREWAIAALDRGAAGTSSRHSTPLPDYEDAHKRSEEWRASRTSKPGDPTASAAAILKVVDAQEPPLRVFFGELPLSLANADYEKRLRTSEEWQPVSVLAQG